MSTRLLSSVTVLGIVGSALVFVACDDSNGVTEPPGGTSSSSSGQSTSSSGTSGIDGGNSKDCFDPPFTTHLQIINACTDADKIVRTPKSTKIQADGGLPKP